MVQILHINQHLYSLFFWFWLHYFLSPIFLTIAEYLFSEFFLRYAKSFFLVMTILISPFFECRSFGCFLKCKASLSISFDSKAICTSEDPVSFSWMLASFIIFVFSLVFKAIFANF